MVKPEDSKKDASAQESQDTTVRIEKGIDPEAEAFMKEQDETVKTEEELTESGNEIIGGKTADLGDDPAATGFTEESNELKKKADSAKSTLNEDLSKETSAENANTALRVIEKEAISGSNVTVRTGEHLNVEAANQSNFTIESNALLTIKGANKNTIFVKRGGRVEIESGNLNVIKYEKDGATINTESVNINNGSEKTEINESEVRGKLIEIKQLLMTLESTKLNASDKRKVLREISWQISELYGNDINDSSVNIYDKYPEFQEIVDLKNKIEKDISSAEKNSTPSDVSPEIYQENPEADVEIKESNEISIESIKNRIKNNEMLSVDEEKYLREKYENILKKSNEQKDAKISEEDKNVILTFNEATRLGLTPKGAEVNEFIDKNDEEIKTFNEKSGEEKDKEINERLEKIKNSGIELGNKIEDAERSINELKKRLKEKNDEFVKMEEDLEKIRDAEGVNEEGARTLINTVSSLRNIYRNKLHIEYYEYWIEYLKGGTKNLHDSHAMRNISMSNWEKLSDELSNDLASMEKGEEEVLRKWAQFIKDHPKTGLALLAAALAAGIALSPYLAKMLAVEKTAGAGMAVVLPAGEAIALMGAKAIGSLASLAGSAGLAGIFLLLTNSEKIDDAMESFWGKKIPSWAYWGLRKKGERK